MKSQSPHTPSLPKQLANQLRQEILGLDAGHKLPRMHALRRRFDVSINTIGAALDILAGEGLVEKRRGSGVYVTEQVRPRIGIVSELDLFDSRIGPYWRATTGKLNAGLRAAGCEPRLYVGSVDPGALPDEPTCPDFWRDATAGQLDGAVILDIPMTEAWYERVQACPIPLVGPLTGHETQVNFSAICALALQRLAEQGCQSVGLLAWHNEALADFEAAAGAAGLHTCPAWLRADLPPCMPGAGWEEFREIWVSSQGRPDGLVVLNDMLFADAQLAILELGLRIPQDLRLVVLTNHEASPPIRLPATIIEIDPAEKASALIELLQARRRGVAPPSQTKTLSFRDVTPQQQETRYVPSRSV